MSERLPGEQQQNAAASHGAHIVWKLPVYNTIHHILSNPIYAGAYAFGRTGSRVTIEAGRKRIVRGFKRERTEWEVLLTDRHEGYLSWAEFERNQRVIADNANSKGLMVRGSVRRGETPSGRSGATTTAESQFVDQRY